MSQAAPKLIQRFRAREVQRLVSKSSLPRSSLRVGSVVSLEDVPLHNPFLPRPLFKRDVNLETSDNPAETAETLKPAAQYENVNIEEKTDGKKKGKNKWVEARYSLRRQAVLVKQARASGILHLLPPGAKLSVEELEAAKREALAREMSEDAKSVNTAKVGEETMSEITVNESDGAQIATQLTTSPLSEPTKTRRPRQLRRRAAALGYPSVVFHWTGNAPTKRRKGLTIYASRRRMFKGHKWERNLDKHRGQIAVRMRDMPKRIARFKNKYRRRRPDPLKPAAPRKRESLPF